MGRGASLQSPAMTAHTTAGRSGDTPLGGGVGFAKWRGAEGWRNAPHSAFLTALRQAFEGYQQTTACAADPRSDLEPLIQTRSERFIEIFITFTLCRSMT